VVITDVNGKKESTPFYFVLQTKGQVEQIVSITVNDKPVPVDLLHFIEVRRKRYQCYFSSKRADPEEVQKEKIKAKEIEAKAAEKVNRLTGEEVLESMTIYGRCYHLLPHGTCGTICPTSDQLNLMDLQMGENIMKVRVALHRESHRGIRDRDLTLNVHLWYYSNDSKFVISDIDGTITRHEIRHWVGVSNKVHAPIIELLNSYKKTGTHFMYITMRPFNSTESRRKFLHGIGAPDGCMLTCPVDLRAIFRAYANGGAVNLKLIHLLYMKRMFPDSAFQAALGNTPQDTEVYKTVLPMKNIFNVLPGGLVGERPPTESVIHRAKSMLALLLGSAQNEETDSSEEEDDEDSTGSL